MTTRYAILNPLVGEYEYVDSPEEILIRSQELAWQFYLAQTHGAPVSQVDTDAEGSETWSAVDLNTL
jgi:hypothetical protein